MTASNPTTSTAPSHHANVVPSEVGWQFVPQYYTFVNKEPHRLHCFYSKNSTFIHGTEGEDMKPCFGQQEIHNKITSIGFEDCKVFIHSVDAQSSANGGIIIQVIGEMSNHSDPWRKFVQTFFLAEQPNGYFVLNDIFRFLKEEAVEGDDGSDFESEHAPATAATAAAVSNPTTSTEAPAPQPETTTYEHPPHEDQAPAPQPMMEPAPAAALAAPPAAPIANVLDDSPAVDLAEPITTQAPIPEPVPSVVPLAAQAAATTALPNGIHEHEKAAPPVVVNVPEPAPSAAAAPAPQPAPALVTAPPAPAPAAPPAAKSWAALAASNTRKWGPNVAQDSRGMTETVSAPAPAPPAQQQQQQQQQRRHDHPYLINAQNVSHGQCFIKGVTESISHTALGTALSRFGPVKDLEIIRSRTCAFVEFLNVENARRAIIASLHTNQGGDGGVWIHVGEETGPVRIFIETKKERSERERMGGDNRDRQQNQNGRPRQQQGHQGQGQQQGAPVNGHEGGIGRSGGGGGSFRGRGRGGGGRGGAAGGGAAK